MVKKKTYLSLKREGGEGYLRYPSPDREWGYTPPFRFGVISDFVVAHPMARGERERLLSEKAERQWVIPYSRRTRISVSTITTWIRRYLRSGWKLESLYPQGRGDRGRVGHWMKKWPRCW